MQLGGVSGALNVLHSPLVSIQDLVKKFLSFFDNVWAFMAIYIHSFPNLFALIPQLEPEPSVGSRLGDCAIYSKRGEDHLIDVLAQHSRCDSAQSLGCKIGTHIVQYAFIVK